MLGRNALPGYELFHPALKNASFQENAPATFEAFETDISTKPDHLPVIITAGVNFFQADDITEFCFPFHPRPL
jgi:hypothetical protein